MPRRDDGCRVGRQGASRWSRGGDVGIENGGEQERCQRWDELVEEELVEGRARKGLWEREGFPS